MSPILRTFIRVSQDLRSGHLSDSGRGRPRHVSAGGGLGMDVSDLDFGNVPSWLALLFSLLSLIISWRSALAAAKERKQKLRDAPWSAARQVTISPAEITSAGQGKLRVRAEAYNGGTLPISNVWIYVNSKLIKGTAVDRTPTLAPGATFPFDQVIDEEPDPGEVLDTDRLNATVSFGDADNYQWQRWADGTLKPVIDARPRGGKAWRWLKRNTPLGRLTRWRRTRDNRAPLRIERPPRGKR
jgi:hypothetical protein